MPEPEQFIRAYKKTMRAEGGNKEVRELMNSNDALMRYVQVEVTREQLKANACRIEQECGVREEEKRGEMARQRPGLYRDKVRGKGMKKSD